MVAVSGQSLLRQHLFRSNRLDPDSEIQIGSSQRDYREPIYRYNYGDRQLEELPTPRPHFMFFVKRMKKMLLVWMDLVNPTLVISESVIVVLFFCLTIVFFKTVWCVLGLIPGAKFMKMSLKMHRWLHWNDIVNKWYRRWKSIFFRPV